MATNLNIRVTGVDRVQQAAAGFGGAGRATGAGGGLGVETAGITRIQRSLEGLQRTASSIGDRLTQGFRQGETAAERLRRTEANNAAQLSRQREQERARDARLRRSSAQRELQEQRRVALAVTALRQRQNEFLDRQRENALKRQERRELRSVTRIAQRRRRLESKLTGLGRGTGGALASAGGGIGGSIGGLLGGGGLNPAGLLRSAGNFAGAGVSAAGNLVGSFTGGLAKFIPVVGGAFGGLIEGGIKAASSLGAGVLNLAGDIGGQIAGAITTGAKVALVAGLGLAVAASAQAIKEERLEVAFEGFATAVGEDVPSALKKLEDATQGTISRAALLQASLRALQFGTVQNIDQFADLAEGAVLLGAAMGRTPVEALEDLSLGIARQSRLILDNLGIIVNAKTAYENFAAANNKLAKDLSESERRLAFQAEAIRQVKEGTKGLSSITETTSFTFARFKKELVDLLGAAGRPLLAIFQAIVPELTRIAKRLAEFLNDRRVQIAESLTSALEGIPNALKKAADFLEGFDLTTILAVAELQIEKFGLAFSDVFARVRKEAKLLAVQIDESLDFTIPGLPARKKNEERRRDLENLAEKGERLTLGQNANRRAEIERRQSDLLNPLPPFAEKVRDASRDLREKVATAGQEFLFKVRKSAERIGEAILRRSAQELKVSKEGEIIAANTASTPTSAQRQLLGQQSLRGIAGGGGGGFLDIRQLIVNDVRKTFASLAGQLSTRVQERPDRIAGEGFGLTGQPLSSFVAGRQNIRGQVERIGLPKDESDSLLTRAFDKAKKDLVKLTDITESLTKVADGIDKEARLSEATKGVRERLTENERKGETESQKRLEAERAKERTEREIADLGKKRKVLAEQLTKFEEDRVEQVKNTVSAFGKRLQETLRGIRSNFAGQLASARGDRALPGNIRRGFAKAGRIEDGEVRDRLRREFGRFSSGEIARDPALQARIESSTIDARFNAQAPIRAARLNEVTNFSDQIGPLREELEAAQKENAQLLKEALTEIEENAKAVRDQYAEQNSEITKFADAAKAVNAESAAILQDTTSKLASLSEEMKRFREQLRRISASSRAVNG